MGVRAFSPAERPPVRFVDDAELAYVAARCVCVCLWVLRVPARRMTHAHDARVW